MHSKIAHGQHMLLWNTLHGSAGCNKARLTRWPAARKMPRKRTRGHAAAAQQGVRRGAGRASKGNTRAYEKKVTMKKGHVQKRDTSDTSSVTTPVTRAQCLTVRPASWVQGPS